MCPCPFCTAVVILLAPLLLFKKSRVWLKNKVMCHHQSCEVCQHAEHMKDHTPCHCAACAHKEAASDVSPAPVKKAAGQKKAPVRKAAIAQKTVVKKAAGKKAVVRKTAVKAARSPKTAGKTVKKGR